MEDLCDYKKKSAKSHLLFLETDNPTGGSPVKSPQSKSKEAASASSPSAVIRSPTAAVESPMEKSGFQSECRCGSKNCRKVLF